MICRWVWCWRRDCILYKYKESQCLKKNGSCCYCVFVSCLHFWGFELLGYLQICEQITEWPGLCYGSFPVWPFMRLWQSLSQCQRRLTSGTKAPSLQVAPVIWKVPLDSLHTQLAVRPGSLTGLTPVSDPLFHKAIYLQCGNTEAAWAGASEEGSHTKELLGFYTITV